MKWYEDKKYLMLVEDLLVKKEVQSLETFVHHKVTNRLEHSLTVSYLSYLWAERLGLDSRAIARAGLLHDLFFYEGKDKHEVGGRGHNWEHPRIALKNAKKLTDLSPVEEDIILKHMFGVTFSLPKYAESLIVSLMDKQAAMMELSSGAARAIQAFYQARRAKLLSILL